MRFQTFNSLIETFLYCRHGLVWGVFFLEVYIEGHKKTLLRVIYTVWSVKVEPR